MVMLAQQAWPVELVICADPTLLAARARMMLATESLRVALMTTHLPLLSVPIAITRSALAAVIKIIVTDLQPKFGIAQPCIYVCGLNPHAGEGDPYGTGRNRGDNTYP